MRARLGELDKGEDFQFICTADMAGKMDRVVTFAGGIIQSKEPRLDGVVISVMKAELKKRYT